MSSEVETSLDFSGSKTIPRFLDLSANDKVQQATQLLFADLAVYHDKEPHSAAINMAIDEALLESATIPIIRFYRWRSPALSFGYFGKFSDVAIYAIERDLVRRWTGGGVVFHGDDLTYSMVIPASDPVFEESSIAIYEKIHQALAHALNRIGEHAEVAASTLRADHMPQRGLPDNSCFANPVRADVMMEGRKIAGAAQRRTRRGLLQQGSIQGFTIKSDLGQKFAEVLTANYREFEIDKEILQRAQKLAQEKYATESWLRKR